MARLTYIERIIAQSFLTFRQQQQQPEPVSTAAGSSSTETTELFQGRVRTLVGLLGTLTSEDVGFQKTLKCLLLSSQTRPPASPTTDLGYIPILDDDAVTIGIFVIRPGKRIRLHNHPHMHGILKCIHGNIDVTAYSAVEDKEAAFKVYIY